MPELARAPRLVLLLIVLSLAAPSAFAICEGGGLSKPNATVSATLAPNGDSTVSVSYKFPNTNPATTAYLQRWVDVSFDGVSIQSTYLQSTSGTWTFPYSFSCRSTGTHNLGVLASACGQSHEDFTSWTSGPLTINSTPEVSIAGFGFDPAGNATVDVSYNFPNTYSHLQRLVNMSTDVGTWDMAYVGNIAGTVKFFVPACTKVVNAAAVACGYNVTTSAPRPQGKPSFASVSVLKIGIDETTTPPKPIFQATVDYSLNTNGTVQVDLESWVNADGAVVSGYPLQTYNVPTNPRSGIKTFTFTAPTGAQHATIAATATTACGTAKTRSGVDCETCQAASGNPVYFSDGNMRLDDGDRLPPIAGHSLSRTYNSDEQIVALFGRGWSTLFDRRLIAHTGAVSIVTETNNVVRFDNVAGTWQQSWPTARNTLGTLTHDSIAGTYTHRPPGSTEVAVFSASNGRLLALRDTATAREAVIGYDTSGRPETFTDTTTEVAWNLAYDGSTRRVESISVEGRSDLTWTYSYDGNGNLLTVLAPGTAPWRTYEYSANRMTASYDALGNVIESHTYDSEGFAISSTGNIDEIADIEYATAGSTTGERITLVTYKTGAEAEYRFRPVGNGWRPVQIAGGCASCGVDDATFVFDERGRTVREQGADGYVTRSVYSNNFLLSVERYLKPTGCDPQTDAQHCRLDTDALKTVVLEATSATVTTTYEHGDSLWPERVTATLQPSILESGEMRRDEFGFHPVTGAQTSVSIEGWTGETPAVQERISQTSFYSDCAEPCPPYDAYAPAFVPGGTFETGWLSLPQPSYLPRSSDGPRTDATDVKMYVYYPIDATVPALLRGRLAAEKNALGHITHYESYDIFGNATRVVEPNGVAMERTFDALGRLLTSTIKGVSGCNTSHDALCATDLTTTLTYFVTSGPLRLEQRPGGGVTAYTYDARGRVQTVSRGPAENDLRERIETSYDTLTGKKSLEKTLAFVSGSWVEKTRQTSAYDNDARLQTVTHADSAAMHYAYDVNDRLASIRDENHASPNTVYAYDPAGRLASVTQTLAGAPGGVIVTHYAYDANGNLISVTDPNGNATSYVFDDFGRMISQVSPVTGTTTYEFDSAGNLTQTTDANSATTVRTYDPANRVLTAVSTRGFDTDTVEWTYDNSASGAFGLGRLATMEDPSGVTEYVYERRGMLRKETHTILGSPYVQTYGYDANGNRMSLGYPSGRVVTYTFDYAGRPLSANGTISSLNTSYVTAATYLPFGPMTSLTLGNGTVETRTYNSRYLPLTSSLTHGVTTIAQYAYTNDPVGNITAIADSTDATYNRTFGYDDLSRLTTANTGTSLWSTGSFTYDRMGNMLATTLGVASQTFTHQGTTPLINTATGLTTSMTYDDAGNELKSPAGEPGAGNAAYYSPRNLPYQQFVRAYDRCFELYGNDCTQPDPVEEWRSNIYDGRGVRVIATRDILGGWISGEGPQTDLYFYTPELSMLNFVTPTTSRIADVIWFGSRPVADHGDAAARYTFTDHLGTPILQTTPSVSVVWRAEYEPFGNVYALRAGTVADDQPLRFPGQQVAYRTAAGEENYNIHRWYRSAWGRYTQSDPVGLGAGTNLYSYVEGDPINYIDPLGLMTFNWSWGPNPHPSPDPGGDCKQPGKQKPDTKVACTNFVDAMLECECACAGLGWEPQVTLHVTLEMYISIYVKPGMSKDKSIIGFDTAVEHEVQKHAAKGADAVKAWLDSWMKPFYESAADCEGACKGASNYNPYATFKKGWDASGANSD